MNNILQDISVFKYLKYLTQLDLSCNSIFNTFILRFNKELQTLNLAQNRVQNIAVLLTLKKLTCLNLGYNNLSDISALKYLPNIQQLELQNNEIVCIQSLSSLIKLTKLEIYNNYIEDSDLKCILKHPNIKEYNYKNQRDQINSQVILSNKLKKIFEITKTIYTLGQRRQAFNKTTIKQFKENIQSQVQKAIYNQISFTNDVLLRLHAIN
ncbi:leucine-rich_repeat domain-containing protein [Hexamita inflata]|uniref:Leucine-rich repeat domain-containing protein n=1 Tax=Hexamita inflata TaxID=28002 RepID=A0AA86NQ91_9EUKA|nr:leucine-rich repeat domain-containing protein [Hexamita inflata]